MENGRIEVFRALPVHREAQPCFQPPQWAKYIQGTLIFPLMGIPQTQGPKPSPVTPTFLACLQEAPLGGSWPLAAANLRVRALRPGESSQNRLRGSSSLRMKREDDVFEVGIEGVALNPNRK